MSNKTLLSIDCGTQSLRALIFSVTGDLLGRAQIEYAPYFSVKPGWAEQDPEVFWNSLCRACARRRLSAARVGRQGYDRNAQSVIEV